MYNSNRALSICILGGHNTLLKGALLYMIGPFQGDLLHIDQPFTRCSIFRTGILWMIIVLYAIHVRNNIYILYMYILYIWIHVYETWPMKMGLILKMYTISITISIRTFWRGSLCEAFERALVLVNLGLLYIAQNKDPSIIRSKRPWESPQGI